jgi:hypothetical protein
MPCFPRETPDIAINGNVYTTRDWDGNPNGTIAAIAAEIEAAVDAEIASVIVRAPQLSDAPRWTVRVEYTRNWSPESPEAEVSPEPAAPRRELAPFPARALRSAPGEAPFLEFSDALARHPHY